MRTQSSTLKIVATTLVAGSLATAALAADPYATAPAYVKPVLATVTTEPIVTIGQQIPLAGGLPTDTFRIVGIPDGMGASKLKGNEISLLLNHEFNRGQGGVAGPFTAGARVSELFLDVKRPKGPITALSGRNYANDAFNGDEATPVAPGTRQIARLCSAFLANREVGFDRNIFLNGEEASSNTFDAAGPMAFAWVDDAVYSLPRMGRAAWENIVVVPGTKEKTVAFALEDGSGIDSEIYMYVGDKVKKASDPLIANGLRNGELYVFVSDDPVRKDEITFTTKGATIQGHFDYVDWSLPIAGLGTAAKAAGAFGFYRVEDGASDPKADGVFYFVTTGSPGTADPFGRLYRLEFDVNNPALGPARLTLVLDGSEGVVSPDNIAMNRQGEIMLLEDPNYDLTTVPQAAGRDSSVWIYNVKTKQLTRVAEMDKPAAAAHALAADPLNLSNAYKPGDWETSGVIDAEEWLGRGAWILNVQAHTLRINPSTETVQGGQLLTLRVETKK